MTIKIEPESPPAEQSGTLRDMFAMVALEAITSRGTFEAAQVAKAAYALADAMMEARKK